MDEQTKFLIFIALCLSAGFCIGLAEQKPRKAVRKIPEEEMAPLLLNKNESKES